MSNESCVTLFPEIETVTRKLDNEQFGILIRAVIAYRFRGEQYTGEDAALDIAFQFLSSQVDRSEAAKERKSRAAQKRWNAEPMQIHAKPMHSDAKPMHSDAPIQSDPVQSDPVQSVPVQSVPVQMDSQKNITSSASSTGKGAYAPPPEKKRSFGKYGWVKLAPREYEALKAQLGEKELSRCISFLDESCQSNGNKNRWKDFGLVIQRCAREGWGMTPYVKPREEIPKGASGVLGEAELRNLQRVMGVIEQ